MSVKGTIMHSLAGTYLEYSDVLLEIVFEVVKTGWRGLGWGQR